MVLSHHTVVSIRGLLGSVPVEMLRMDFSAHFSDFHMNTCSSMASKGSQKEDLSNPEVLSHSVGGECLVEDLDLMEDQEPQDLGPPGPLIREERKGSSGPDLPDAKECPLDVFHEVSVVRRLSPADLGLLFKILWLPLGQLRMLDQDSLKTLLGSLELKGSTPRILRLCRKQISAAHSLLQLRTQRVRPTPQRRSSSLGSGLPVRR